MTRIHTINGPVTNKEIIENVARNLGAIAEVVLSEIEDFQSFDEYDLRWMQEHVEAENEVLYELCKDFFGVEQMMEVDSD